MYFDMERKFENLAKVFKYLELDIEGSFGKDGITYTEFQKYDRKALRDINKSRGDWERFVLLRDSGTIYCHDARLLLEAVDVFKATAKMVVRITKTKYDGYKVCVQPADIWVKYITNQ